MHMTAHETNGASKLTSMLTEAQCRVDDGHLDAAARLYEQVMLLAPDQHQLHHVLGLVYLELGRIADALPHICRSTQLDPANAGSYRSLGDAYRAAGRPAAAVSAYQKALSLSPTDVDIRINLGNALYELDSPDQAMASFQEALRLCPEDARVLNNIGKLYHDMLQLERALGYYDKSLAYAPDYAEARFNRAVTQLTLGDFKQGWSEYEWRFKRRNAHKVYPHRLLTPRWEGQPFKGRRLLVHCEQGMGDVLQFVRYLPMVKTLGGTLILEAHAPLLPLLGIMDCIDELVPFNATSPPDVPHDLHVPLLSLPHIFQTTTDTIPNTVPYLTPDPRKTHTWKNQLTGSRIRIGLVWASGTLNPKRNIGLEHCTSWFQIPGIQFYSLQKGPAAAQLHNTNTQLPVIPLGQRFDDFGATAAAIANLDLIISVDTAVAHLAGAMGKALWVLVPHEPDWRWPPQQKHSSWYPSARLFRQNQSGRWDPVVAEATAALQQLTRNANRETAPGKNAAIRSTPSSRTPMPPGDHTLPKPSLVPTSKKRHAAKKKINRVLLVSPLFGGSLEVIRYLHAGFRQTGIAARLLDNSSLYPFYNELDRVVADDQNRTILQNQLLNTLDARLIACAAEFKPDLVLAVAQSPINAPTAARLRSAGITCAYWFVEDYRFKTYWPTKVPDFDFFFTIQRDEFLCEQFESLGYKNWHYLPLACEPAIHQPWHADPAEHQNYRCQLGFMGSPYLNRLRVFDQLTQYSLGVWGQGWDQHDLSPALKACVREGNRRITPEESVKIYSSADIIINLHSSPFVDGINPDGDFVNPRTFEIAACAGFQLSDNRKELAPLFSLNDEIVVFRSFAELVNQIDYWLAHPHLRREVSRKAQARACRDHTYKHRAMEILQIIENGPL
jgi:spore maturation protein CgeB/Tfp pilus assembly protein PilF